MIINVLEYLESAAEKYTEKIALEDESKNVTYGQYLDAAKRIGSYIVDSLAGIHGRPVAVLINRNIESIIAFMGCVYSGNFYVPLDVAMPIARVKKIIEMLEPAVIINASGKTVEIDADIVSYDEAVSFPENEAGLEVIREQMTDIDPLYAIFTSGSTGMPKGVLIAHRGVIDLAEQFTDIFGFEDSQIFANQAPFDFDVSVKDIYCCLKNGATLVIVPKRLFTMPVKLIEFINQKKIDTMIWAVSALRIIADSDLFSKISIQKIKYVMFSGEVMPIKTLNYLRSYMKDTMFVNLYGPTEITCNCTYYIIPEDFCAEHTIPIGKAFKNERVFIVGPKGVIREQNVRGELCVSGSCLGLGYYNNHQKTEEAFQNDNEITQYPVRVYHTGDLAYYDENWQLVFASRSDFQIKHMGHRIELGEIESVLNECSFIKVSCCLFDEAAGKIICFYESDKECKKDIVLYLKELLPKYMWPNVFRWYEQLPYNAHGKIDRVKLKEEWKRENSQDV